MKSVGLLIAAFLASVAHAQVDYPIVYCDQDRPAPPAWGDTPEVSLPWITKHTRLMLRNPDGSTEVLFEPDANAAVMDPQVSLDAMPREGDTVTEAEIRTIAEWIDTGAMHYADSAIRDDTKPTLFIHSPRRETSPLTQVVVSAADAELDKASLKVTLNGAALSLTEDDHIWSATVPSTESGELVAEVKDEFGNLTRLVRTFGPSTTPTPDPDPDPDPDPTDPDCEELEARVAELEAELQAALADVASSVQQIQTLEMQVQSLQSKIAAAKAALEN